MKRTMYTLDDFKVLRNNDTGNFRIINPMNAQDTHSDEEFIRPQKWPADIMCAVMSVMITSHEGLNIEAVRLPYTIRESMQLCGYSDTQIREVLFCTMCKISDNNSESGKKKYSKHLYPISHL